MSEYECKRSIDRIKEQLAGSIGTVNDFYTENCSGSINKKFFNNILFNLKVINTDDTLQDLIYMKKCADLAMKVVKFERSRRDAEIKYRHIRTSNTSAEVYKENNEEKIQVCYYIHVYHRLILYYYKCYQSKLT
jgi:hypothetical protein